MQNESTTTAATTTKTSPDWRSKRPLLWVVLALSGAANVVTQTAGANLFISAAFGLLTLLSGVALAVDHYRHR